VLLELNYGARDDEISTHGGSSKFTKLYNPAVTSH